jgi:hypothetical protein
MAMPRFWLVTMAILVACLLASITIGTVRLLTTQTEVLDVPLTFNNRDWRALLPPG